MSNDFNPPPPLLKTSDMNQPSHAIDDTYDSVRILESVECQECDSTHTVVTANEYVAVRECVLCEWWQEA